MADPFDYLPDSDGDFEDEYWQSVLPDSDSNFAESWGDYASDLGKSAVTGLVGGSVGLAERLLTGGAAAAGAVGLPLGVRDFLLEQGLTAKNVKEQVYDAGLDRERYGSLSAPAILQGAIGGVAEYSPAFLNPLLGSTAIGLSGAAKKYYDLPIQAEEGVVPSELQRLGSGAAMGTLEGLGAGLPMPFINKPLQGAKDFLGRTAKVAGIGTATNVPLALTDMATNEEFGGQDFTPEQYLDATKEAAATSVAGAPLFTALGAFGARRPRVPNIENFDTWAPPFEPPPPADPLGLPAPQGKLPAPPDRTYGPDAAYVMRDVPAVTELPDSYLPSKFDNEKTTTPEPVQLKVTARGIEEDGVITVKRKPEPSGLVVEATSARTPEQIAEAAAIRAEMEPGALWSRQIDEGTRTPVYGERREAPELLGRATRSDGRPVKALDPVEREIVQGIMDEKAPIYESYRIGGKSPFVVDPRLMNAEVAERTKAFLTKPDGLTEDVQGVVKVKVAEPVSEGAAARPITQSAKPEQGSFGFMAPESASGLKLYVDGVEGREVPWNEVPQGNEAFQYALGRVTEDGGEAVFRRPIKQRGSYGGWRYEVDANKIKPSATEATPAPKQSKSRLSDERGAIEPGLLEDIAKGAQKVGDSIKEAWGSVVGFKDGDALPDIERFLTGEGFRVLPKKYQGDVRQGLIFPRTLAEKDVDFRPAYGLTLGTVAAENRSARIGYERLKNYFHMKRVDRAPVDALLIAMRKRAMAARKEGMQLAELTDDTLRKQGFSDEQITGYRAVRDYADWSLDRVEETLEVYARQLPEEDQPTALADLSAWVKDKKESFYVPFVRQRGGWSVRAEDAAGETTYFSVFKTNAEAKRAAKALGKGAKVEQVNPTVPEDLRGLPLDVQIAIGGLLGDVDPKTGKVPEEQTSLRGFRARLAKARLVDGFNEDLAPGLADYNLSLAKWTALTRAAPQMHRIINEIPSNKKALINYTNRYWNDYKKGAHAGASRLLRLVNFWSLAGTPLPAIANTFQLNLTAGLLTAPSWGGKVKDVPAIMANAAKDLTEYAALGAEKFASRSEANAEKAAALQIGLEAGDLDARAMGDLANIRSGGEPKLSMYDVAMKTFTLSEEFTRYVTYLAAYERAKKLGYNFRDSVRYAQEFTRTAMFEMSDANRPQWMRQPWQRVLFQYKPFWGHYLRFLRNSFNARDYSTLAIALGSLSAQAGVRGLPFAAVGISLIDAIFDVNTNQEIRKAVEDEDTANSILFGLPAGAFDINMSPSTGLGDGIPAIDQDLDKVLLNLFGGPLTNILYTRPQKAMEALDKDAPWNAAATLAPRMFRGPIKAAEFNMTGQLSDIYGDPIITKTGDPLRDAYTTGTLLSGAAPTRYTTEYEKRSGEAKLLERARDNDDINLRYAKAMKDNNQEKMQAIMQESIDSLSGPPADWKRIDPEQVKKYFIPRDMRTMRRSPREVRSGIMDLQSLYRSSDE